MKISVVVPTYNRKDSLRITLDGLARQRYPFTDFEVVVVSDGSTDGTDEMLADYAQAAPYSLRSVCQTNGGPAKARNRGIQEAQHEIIVFLDDDVEPVPELLSRHAGHHELNEKIAILGPMSPDPLRSHEEPVWIAWEHAKLQNIYTMFRPGGAYEGNPAGSMHFYSGNASVRRRWLIEVQGFDENYTRQEDVELAVRLQQTCGVTFLYDFAADGIHRPQRSYEAWLRIPEAYGAFDRQRVRAGLFSEADITKNLKKRNLLTRILASLCLACPRLLAPLERILSKSAIGLHRRSYRSLAIAALSGLYNVCYVMAYLRPAVKGQETVKAILPGRQCIPTESRNRETQQDKLDVDAVTPCSQDRDPCSFSVLICTCNRGNSIVGTLQTVFGTDIPCTELIIIDQSDTDATECALAPFRNDPRLRYIHTTVKNKATALNLGLREACCDIVAITDDDVEVLPAWPQYHLAAFNLYPKVVLTYGTVLPVEFDSEKGFIPDYHVPRDRIVTNIWQKLTARGIGANTAVRRKVILDMGGFDPAFGPGALFKGCVDGDMTIRCILNGHHVFESHGSKVYHNGFRNWDQGRTLACNAFYGIGAAHIKALKAGRMGAGLLLLWEFSAYALAPVLWSTLLFRPRVGWRRVLYFLYGVRDGMKLPVDKKNLLFKL